MSLAIELAAARVRLMSLRQLLDRLDQRFALLRGQRRDHGPRQSTLRGAIDWSWQLMTPWERAALAQTSVFHGGLTLDAAEAVLDFSAFADAPWLADVVSALVDQSLLYLAEPRPGHPRVRCYASIQAFAAEKCGADAQPTSMRHRAFYARLGDDAHITGLSRHGGVERRWALALALENLRAAHAAALANGDADTAARCALAMAPTFELRGPFKAGCALLDATLAMPALVAPTPAPAPAFGAPVPAHVRSSDALTPTPAPGDLHGLARRLRYWRGFLRRLSGQPAAAASDIEAALAMQREAGDREGEAHSRAALGILAREAGRSDEARAHFDAALDLHRAVGNRHGEGVVLAHLGLLAQDLGDDANAEACYADSLRIQQETGDRRIEGRMLGNLGLLARARGDTGRARGLLEQTHVIAQEVGDRLGEGIALGNLGDLWLADGDLDQAERCLGQAVPICDETLPTAAGAFRGSLALVRSARGEHDEALALLDRGDALLRGRHAVEHGKLLCKRGEVLAAMVCAGRAARADVEAIVAAAQQVAAAAGVSATSELAVALGRLLAGVEGL